MRVFDSGARQGRHITQYGSDFTMSRLAHTRGLNVGCMRLGPGGVVVLGGEPEPIGPAPPAR